MVLNWGLVDVISLRRNISHVWAFSVHFTQCELTVMHRFKTMLNMISGLISHINTLLMYLPALHGSSSAPLNHLLFVSPRGSPSGCGNRHARGVGSQPLSEGGCLHHGWDWKGLQEGKGNEERWAKDDTSKSVVIRVNWGGPIKKSLDVVMHIVDPSVTPFILFIVFLQNLWMISKMKTWWFFFPSSRHCLSHQRLSQ